MGKVQEFICLFSLALFEYNTYKHRVIRYVGRPLQASQLRVLWIPQWHLRVNVLSSCFLFHSQFPELAEHLRHAKCI